MQPNSAVPLQRHCRRHVGDMSPIYRRQCRRESIIGFGLMLFHLQKCRRHVGDMSPTCRRHFSRIKILISSDIVVRQKFSSPRINNSVWLEAVPLATSWRQCRSHSWSSKNIVPIRDDLKIESKICCAYRQG